MRSFKHINVQTVDEACTLLEKYNGKAVINAGGTDLFSTLKGDYLSHYPQAVINIKTIPGLDYIKEEKGVLKIGALTKLSDIIKSPLLRSNAKALVEATRSVATPQIRNSATLGGNLCQEVRCWYYRYPHQIGGPILCLRKGGKICNALAGDNRYHSIFGGSGVAVYPCASTCPANTDIPSYLKRVRNGDLLEAARIILNFNPIPAITGRVCPTLCEPECNRKEFDEPVAIRCVERSLGDTILERMTEVFTPPGTKSGKSIAIIGSGPAGLAAAYYLRKSGHLVTVFEKLSEAGGMLLYSIPPYRLPKDVVRKQIQALKGMGIKFEVGVNVGKDVTVAKMIGRFDAVFWAVGAWKEKPLGIAGEKVALSGLEFLNRTNKGARDIPGKKVAVIGGGNVAMDVARTLLRLGSEPVVIYRRTRDEMPAFKDEVEKAKEEGIEFQFLTQPTEASKAEGKITLRCVRMKLGAPDASGRPKPVPVPGSEFVSTFDAVIKAIGENPETSLLPAEFRQKARKASSSARHLGKNLFAGGDFITGPSTVVQAIASGREAARLIELSFKDRQPSAVRSGTKQGFTSPSFEGAPRIQVPVLPVSERIKNIDIEDIPSLGLSEIATEASRCFNCGCLAVSPSDIGIALIALDANIVTTKRTLDAHSFFNASATASTALDPEELVTEIQIPKPKDGVRQNYLKFTLRNPIDFGIVSVASSIAFEGGICKDARIALGAVAPSPVRAKRAEEVIKGRPIDEGAAAEAAEQAVAGAHPLSMNAYKVEILKALVKRAILSS
ncbi:MAG TPA: FAD binding domain-containing protein [Thermodesulfobacteriota bacterium]|nr:FAD binding domain-containing protein [Thermodesulfobacteriota bacterium]